MEIGGQILNVDHIVAAGPRALSKYPPTLDMLKAKGEATEVTSVLMRGLAAPLILEVEFAEFRRLLDRLLNLHVTEGETIRHDHHAR